MTSLVILDNTLVEVAVFVDVDEFAPLPIMAAGPNRVTVLEAFRDATPFDLTVMDAGALRIAFGQFLTRVADSLDTPADNSEDAVGDDTGSDDYAQSTLAEHTARDNTIDPAPAPADTDAQVESSVGVVKVRCWNCNGKGAIEFGDNQPPVSCNMCHGQGWVEQPGVQS